MIGCRRLRHLSPTLGLVLAGLAGAGCGAAQPKCLEGLSACGTVCLDLQSEPTSCGSCGHACETGFTCSSGQCRPICATGLAACGSGAASYCADLETSLSDCGACGHACAPPQACDLGVCHLGCAAAGWADCGGACREVRSDPAHCGACQAACASGQGCLDGQCVDASAAAPRLIVSLTADDTFADQFTDMATALEAEGMRGTYYVNAGRVDVPDRGYLSSRQLRHLQAMGHEIGSHGLTHVHLETTSQMPERIAREVCDSRVALVSRGFDVRSIAYPFGSIDGLAQSLADRCGYSTGRSVGTISTASGHRADTVPPARPFEVRAASSVNSANDLAYVEQYVRNAEAEATGTVPSWLVINFHHICPGATCNPALAWDTGLFQQFVEWLAARRAGGTVVRTVSQAAALPWRPPVPSQTPLMLNGAMESYLQGPEAPPDCWLRTSSGSSTVSWSRVEGRTGWAQQVVVRGYASGSYGLLQNRGSTSLPDYLSCGTPVVPGHAYTLSCWYRSDVRVALSLYRNDDVNHVSSSWKVSPWHPASPAGWSQISADVTVPPSFNTLFFGPYMAGVCDQGCVAGPGTATVTIDDCSVVDHGE